MAAVDSQDGQDGVWCTPSGTCLSAWRDGKYIVVEIDRGSDHSQTIRLSPDQARSVAHYLNELAALQKALDPESESAGDDAMAAVRDIAGKR